MKNYAELKMEPPSPIDIDAQLGSNMSDDSIAALMGSGGNVLSKDTVWSIEESKWVLGRRVGSVGLVDQFLFSLFSRPLALLCLFV
jgi:hypothetical protein